METLLRRRMLSGMTSLAHYPPPLDKFVYLHQPQIPLTQKKMYPFVKTNFLPKSRVNLPPLRNDLFFAFILNLFFPFAFFLVSRKSIP